MRFARLLVIVLVIQGLNCFSAFAQSEILSDEDIYEAWYNVLESAREQSSNSDLQNYDLAAAGFLNLYKETRDIRLLEFALYEAGRSYRDRIISDLSDSEETELQETLDKILESDIDPNHFAVRDFKPRDIYTFLGPPIPDDLKDEAENLLNYWLANQNKMASEGSLESDLLKQSLIRGFYKLDNFSKVFEIGQDLIEENRLPYSFFSFTLFEVVSYASRLLGYYNNALYINLNLLQPIADGIDNQSMLYSVKMDYAITLMRIGNTDEALKEYQEIFENIEYLTSARYRSALLNNLAISYLNNGQFEKYIDFQLEAFELASEEENFAQQLSILRNLFIYHRRQNETDLAFNYLNQALKISRERDLSEESASILLSLGEYRRDIEDNIELALQHFKEAQTLADSTDSFQPFYTSLVEIGETYFELGEESLAVEYLEEAMRISLERESTVDYTQAAMRLSNLLSLAGDFDRAREIAYSQDREEFKKLNFNYEILANNALFRILMNDKRYDEAEEIADSMINEIITWLRESIDHQTGHMRMDEEFSEAFRLYTLLMHETHQPEKALIAAGKLRNISRSGFYNDPLLKSQILSDEELVEDYNIRIRIRNLRRQYAEATEDQRVYLGNELLDAISERNELQDRAFPEYRQTDFENDLRQFQRQLERDQMAIYISVFEEQVFRFLVTRSDIQLKVFPKNDELTGLMTSVINSFEEGTTDLIGLHNIYSAYFSDAVSDRYNHIFFIPDGEFYRLPIGILPTQPVNSSQSYGSAHYLIEDVSISYLNTISDLTRDRKEDSGYKYDLAGFGVRDFDSAGHPTLQNLPYSVREVEQGGDHLNKFENKRYFLNSESTESNFRSVAGEAKILHLATHSKVNDENPLFSAIYFHANDETEQQDNGIIYAYELFDMNMSADMVFLSSCESGSGGYLKGAGVLGFSRAFAYAGAKSLSLNLWPVRDQAAATITSAFYDALNSGQNKAEAMRTARLQYLNNHNSDPYLWGSMVLYGNITGPVGEESNPLFVFLTGSLFTMLLLSFFVLAGYNRSLRSWII